MSFDIRFQFLKDLDFMIDKVFGNNDITEIERNERLRSLMEVKQAFLNLMIVESNEEKKSILKKD